MCTDARAVTVERVVARESVNLRVTVGDEFELE